MYFSRSFKYQLISAILTYLQAAPHVWPLTVLKDIDNKNLSLYLQPDPSILQTKIGINGQKLYNVNW